MSGKIYTVEPLESAKANALVLNIGGRERMVIPYPKVHETLMKLMGTGKFAFKGKELVIDLFGKVEFYYHVDAQGVVSGRLKFRDQDMDIRDTDFLCQGAPPFFIKGIFLKFIDPNASWRELKQAYAGTLTLEDRDETLKIVYEGNSEEILKQKQDPFPVLMLKDRSGAFADLWMDYGQERFAYHDPVNGKSRILDAEKSWEKDLLETDFIRKAVDSSHYYCPLDKVPKSLTFLLEIGWTIFDWKGNRVRQQKEIALVAENRLRDVLVKGKVKFEEFEADVVDVLGAFNKRERFVQLGQGQVGLLESSSFQGIAEEGEIVADGIRMNRNKIGILEELPGISYDQTLTNLHERLTSFKGIVECVPGKDFRGTLRPYQQDGLNWLNFLYEYGFHGILADDMGLGKTVQVLAFLSQIKLTGPVLIVLPTTLIFNWKKEIEQFLPSMNVTVHHGPDRGDVVNEPGIILTSYGTLRQDLFQFVKIDFQCVILDEAQTIKNSRTQAAQAVFSLRAQFRLSITGTPIENHLGEIWSQFRFLIPDLLGDETAFASEIQAGSADSRYLQRIKRKIKPFLLRRRKEEVAKDLPERIEQVVWVEMEEEQRRTYEDFLAGVKGNLIKKVNLDGMAKHRMEILEAILRLRQICCHPWLVSAQSPSAKMEALLQDIETAIDEGRKILVFSQFTTMLNLISKAAQERGWKHFTLDGSTTNREKVVTQFQEDSSIPLFLISLKAGGVGLNLTAADYVFLYDPWWNEAVENQAINRAHRIGRKDTVIAKRFIMLESIEEKMMKLKANKRNLVAELLDDGGDNVSGLTEDDLKFLLS